MKKFVVFIVILIAAASIWVGYNYYVANKWNQVDCFPQGESLVFVSQKGDSDEYKVESMTMMYDLENYALPGDEEDYRITTAGVTATLTLELPDGYDENVKHALIRGGLTTSE